MASSSTPLHTDDDDKFDWEAAVQEIDVACQSRDTLNDKPISNSSKFNCNTGFGLNPLQNVHKNENFNVNISSVSSARQSTLDRFIGIPSSNLKKSGENVELIYSNGDRNGCNVECSGVQVLNGFVKIDAEAAKTWIYPVNIPRRDYQFSITRTALFSNTLVVLPTGLGKTLIAAVVMYNYFRWFPEGKIVFAAPSRPLVMQQIEACHNIVGIPQEWTIDLTGKTNPSRRAVFWKSKRVFFVTPQVLEKDIQSGSCLVKHLVCLVIDEAHRATGNYAYCVAVRELMDAPVQLRILALTATPGSKHQAIQVIINNLQISTLEYRSESDLDVLPYVHERKLEVIQVPLGDEAVKICTLLLEVVRPFVTRLSSYGVLPNRDPQTLSPCAFLDSREKFRKEHPPTRPHEKQGEIETCYGALLTLYHIQKLLSSHGIKPAFELFDEKLNQGNLWMVCRNEALLKAKLLMQQTISHGAPSPKLAKLLEVLIDHFKVKDPQNSRVIIFSNFRGSVRDIMNSLANLGELVKAAEFIGQSAGKNLKGQSQKVQQAVLQKFREGGYNVIVATSIGEEGLDIMEVDLVICFDANVSPLRMIQRMGRTGRKHEGRVVILACEGSEMKGYMRKKANSKAIKKHMHNGGMNSFSFHSSPRMIPHIFKPEVKFLEMSIEEFIPRGKKMKDDNFILEPPVYQKKLTDAETVLLAKYFAPKGEISRRPSLIAFPHFQAFPSPVNKVAHSSRTGLLINTMQYLQGIIFCKDTETFFTEDEDSLYPCSRVDMMEPLILRERFDDANEEYLKAKVVQLDIEIEENVRNAAVHIRDPQKQKPCFHSFLFSSEFVSVDDLGNVLILSLPQLPMVSHSKCINSTNHDDNTMQEKNNPSPPSFPEEKDMLETSLMPEKIIQTPVSNIESEEMRNSDEDHNVANDEIDMQLAGESSDECRDSELSPRLTNFIESGVVPESPINNEEATWNNRSISTPRVLFSSQDMKIGFPTTSWQHDDEALRVGTLREMDTPCFTGDDIQTRGPHLDNNEPRGCTPPVPVDKETQTPCAKLSNTSSRDSLFDSGVKPETVEQQCKFRRLRKLADVNEEVCPESNEQTGRNKKPKNCRLNGQKKRAKDVVVYIEDEAEISSDAMASDDEEDGPENSSYEDSFIDDGTNPSSASTQAGCSNMMAVYRRSLLTQSPFPRLPNTSTDFSPDTVVQHTRLDESSSLGNKENETPQIGLESTGRNSQITCDKISTEVIKNDNKPDSRKRKLSSYQAPVVNLYKEFSLLSEVAGVSKPMQIQIDKVGNDVFIDEDDQFLEGVDLDAIEEEAAKQLRYRSQCSMQKTPANEKIQRNFGILGSPSFDLGI